MPDEGDTPTEGLLQVATASPLIHVKYDFILRVDQNRKLPVKRIAMPRKRSAAGRGHT